MSHTTLLLLPRAVPESTEVPLTHTCTATHKYIQIDRNAQGMHAGEHSYPGDTLAPAHRLMEHRDQPMGHEPLGDRRDLEHGYSEPSVRGNSRADQLAHQLPVKSRLVCLDPEAVEG